MKKIIALLLASLIAVCLLSACGSQPSEADSEKNTQAVIQSTEVEPTTTEKEDNVIEFQNVIILDDENARIELINFCEDGIQMSENHYNAKEITFRLTNKTEKAIGVHIRQTNATFNGEPIEVDEVSSRGGSLEAGETREIRGVFYFLETAENGIDITPKYIDSFDDLFLINGGFQIQLSEDDYYNVDFSAQTAKEGIK